MINLKQAAASLVVVLTVAALPVNAFAEEANFGLLGEIFGTKTPEKSEGDTKPADAAAKSAEDTKPAEDTNSVDAAAKPAEDTKSAEDIQPADATDVAAPEKLKGHKSHVANLKGVPAGNIKALIAQHAAANGVPLQLADAIVRIESRYNPRATNHGAMGLMQIKAQTARGVGFSGPARELLNADTNLRYGMKYLAQVFNMSGGNVCATVMRYQTGMAATHLSAANRAYCAKAKAIMG